MDKMSGYTKQVWFGEQDWMRECQKALAKSNNQANHIAIIKKSGHIIEQE